MFLYYATLYKITMSMTEAVCMPRALARGNLASSGSRASELEELRPLVKHGVYDPYANSEGGAEHSDVPTELTLLLYRKLGL